VIGSPVELVLLIAAALRASVQRSAMGRQEAIRQVVFSLHGRPQVADK
jgi:hypothetical protein